MANTFTITKSALDEEYDYWVEASYDDTDVDMTAIEADYNKVFETVPYDKETDTLTFNDDIVKALMDNHFIAFIIDKQHAHLYGYING